MVMETFAEDENETLDYASALARVENWQRRIDALYRDLIAWSPPGFTADTIQSVKMMEERMVSLGVGERQLPVLNIYDGGDWKAKVIPYGLWIVGADGQLDLLTPTNQFFIVGRATSDGAGWRLARTDGDWTQVELNEKTWNTALQ